MKISFTPRFKDLFRKLPAQVKKQAGHAFEHLEHNPRYPESVSQMRRPASVKIFYTH